MENKVNWNEQHVIWIRTGKVGSSSFHFAFSGRKPNDNFVENGEITTKVKFGKIIEIQSDEIGYSYGVNSFRDKYHDVWYNGYKVIIVRNPYDRFISAWKFLKQTKDLTFNHLMHLNFNKFSRSVNYHIIRPLSEDLIIDDKLEVDHIIKFEDYQKDFDDFCEKISHHTMTLPHVRKGSHDDYKNYYNQERADFVYNLMKDDFKYFNYDKDSWK